MRVYSTEIQANKSEALVDDRSIYTGRLLSITASPTELLACLPILSILCPVVGIYIYRVDLSRLCMYNMYILLYFDGLINSAA